MNHWLRHLLFWIGYVCFKTYLNVSAEASPAASLSDLLTLTPPALLAQGALLFIKVPVVYTLFYILERYFQNRLPLLYTVSLTVLVFALAVPLMLVMNHLVILPEIYHTYAYPLHFSAASMLYHFFTLAAVAGIAMTIKLVGRQLRSNLHQQQLMREKAETELKFLKAQVNPHFLFNTLNNIYSLARRQSPATADAVLKLSKLMRFMLYESGHARIPLNDELQLIRDYIELEKLRYGDRLSVTLETSINGQHPQIAPLLLIHFVENAFKHGASESRFESFVAISISLDNDVLTARFNNSREATASASNTPTIGLANIRRQLELLYPNHTLQIDEAPDQYTVTLTLPVDSK